MIDMIRLQKHSKRDLKNSKIIQKQLEELHREAQAMNRKYEDRNNNAESDDENDYFDRKAKKWWARFDQRNFPPLSNTDCAKIREITTSDRILQQMPKQTVLIHTYYKEKLLPQYELFGEEQMVHILFKTKNPSFRCLASYELEQAIPSYSENTTLGKQVCNFKVSPSAPDIEIQQSELKQIKLCLAGFNEDENICRSVRDFKKAKEKLRDRTEVERELYLWEKQLSVVNKQNNLAWDKLVKKVKSEASPNDQSAQIASIKIYLLWATILKYFENGYQDKTKQQLNQLIEAEKLLKPTKSKDAAATKKFFQTDCKICFCSFNYDSNQVLYCDQCNTSFHLACYGLQEIPKEEIYYCDCCRYKKKENSKRIVCQLCNKTFFPIKELNGHFYHVTCLMLFNLIRIDKGTLALREGLTHFKIMQMVVESELCQKQCEFCMLPSSQIGIKMECSYPNCKNSAHPICAYTNGCKFNIKRAGNSQTIKVEYECNLHDFNRDWVLQTYLRRYMCNLRKTSQLNEHEFREKFKSEIAKRNEQKMRGVPIWNTNRIIAKTRLLKKRLSQDDNRQNIASSMMQTESRKVLEKLIKRKN